MASMNFSVLVILSVFLISIQYYSVNALNEEQYDKIVKFCSNIRDPDECVKCISSDNRAPTAEDKGLATIAVQCTSEPMSLMLDYLHAFHTQPLKAVVEGCSLPLENARDVFAYIDGKIEGNNYGDAQFAAAHKIQKWLSQCHVILRENFDDDLFHAYDMLLTVIRPCDNLVQILAKLAKEGGKKD